MDRTNNSNTNKNDTSTAKERAWTWITPQTKKMLSQLADEENTSVSEEIRKAVTFYLAKDLSHEEIIVSKLSDLQHKYQKSCHDTEMTQKLLLDYLQYFFLFAPDIPKEILSAKIQQANRDVQAFLKNFRHRMNAIKPLAETIFGDMLEKEVEDCCGQQKQAAGQK